MWERRTRLLSADAAVLHVTVSWIIRTGWTLTLWPTLGPKEPPVCVWVCVFACVWLNEEVVYGRDNQLTFVDWLTSLTYTQQNNMCATWNPASHVSIPPVATHALALENDPLYISLALTFLCYNLFYMLPNIYTKTDRFALSLHHITYE